MLIITPPWTSRTWALPFLCVLLTSEKVDAKGGRRHKTVPEWTKQLVKVVHRWLPTRPIKLIGDGAYSVVELGLACRKQQATLIAPYALMHVSIPLLLHVAHAKKDDPVALERVFHRWIRF